MFQVRHLELGATPGKRLADLHAKEGVTFCKSIDFKNFDSNSDSSVPSPTPEPQYDEADLIAPLIYIDLETTGNVPGG